MNQIGEGRDAPVDELLWEQEPLVLQAVHPVKRKMSVGAKLLLALAAIVVAFIIFIIFFVGIKLYHISRNRDPDVIVEDVEKYLEKRYDQKFSVLFNRGMGPAYNYVQLYAYPQGVSDEMHKIEVQGYYNRWRELVFFDDYVQKRLTLDYKNYLSPLIKQYFDTYRFYIKFDSEWITNNLPVDTTLEDLLEGNVSFNRPTMYLYARESDAIDFDNLDRFAKTLSDSDFRGEVDIVIYYDERFNNVTEHWNSNVNSKDYDNIYIFFVEGRGKYEFTRIGGNHGNK